MATLEDKILGDKVHNYCSSSEDEQSDSETESKTNVKSEPASLPTPNKWEGTATNTGPKGVIKDWQRFKQLENEKRAEAERERLALMKKLTLSCRTTLDDEREKAAAEDPDLADLLNDDYLFEYQKQRMQEMLKNHSLTFGKVYDLTSGQEFLNAVDKEDKNVTIVIHIYEPNIEACKAMNACFDELCIEYSSVKFCRMVVSKAGMSERFKISGVPALLVYKSGQLVGNFVRVSDDLGNDFNSEDVQGFLIEHGMLLDKSCVPRIIRQTDDTDSD